VRIVEKTGWKVQLFSTTDFYKADTVYFQAVDDFIDEEVVKVFNSPNYKIRVGNCTTRESAEELLRRALDLKYRDAWIIRTSVKVEERLILY
jgi:DNA/RNA-binding domain of Phe-tRNA-synthetase-like protein